jgi:hypothetical protein
VTSSNPVILRRHARSAVGVLSHVDGAAYTTVAPPPFTPHVRPMREDELPYVIDSWAEGYKHAPAMRALRYADYKALHVPVLRAALARPDTTVMMVDGPIPRRAVGWLALARWPSIDVVHWVYVARQYRDPDHHVLLALLAQLRDRVSYTHKGQVGRGERQRSDVWLESLLRERGATVSYIPYSEWAK